MTLASSVSVKSTVRYISSIPRDVVVVPVGVLSVLSAGLSEKTIMRLLGVR